MPKETFSNLSAPAAGFIETGNYSLDAPVLRDGDGFDLHAGREGLRPYAEITRIAQDVAISHEVPKPEPTLYEVTPGSTAEAIGLHALRTFDMRRDVADDRNNFDLAA
jgi:hypothetical protein